MDSPERLLGTVAALAAAILCHETGHFLCARSVGLPVEEFAIGFGPELISIGGGDAAKGTVFNVRALPFGGYVRFSEQKTIRLESGEMVTEFDALPAPQRLLVLAGGVILNTVVAWSSLCAAALTTGVPRNVPLPGIQVDDVGAEALVRTGLQRDDVLLRIGSLDLSAPGNEVTATVDFIRRLPKAPVELLVRRGDEQLRLDVTCLTDTETGFQKLGVLISSNTERILVKAVGLAEAAGVATDAVARLLGDQLKALQNIASGTGAGEVVGPVGILRQGQELASAEGLLGLGFFFVTVNLNLALLNALPVPALDGGKVVFVLVEQVLGRRLDEEKKQDVEFCFVLLVLAALLNLTVKDIANIFK